MNSIVSCLFTIWYVSCLFTNLESEVFFTAAIVGFCTVGIKVNGQRFASQRLEEEVLPHEFPLEVIHFSITVGIVFVHSSLEFVDGILTVLDFSIDASIESSLGGVAVGILLVQPEDQLKQYKNVVHLEVLTQEQTWS